VRSLRYPTVPLQRSASRPAIRTTARSADIVGVRTEGVTRAAPLHDVLSHLVFAAHGDDVVFTMVDGNVLMEDGEVTVADADAIRQEAHDIDLDLEEARKTAQDAKP